MPSDSVVHRDGRFVDAPAVVAERLEKGRCEKAPADARKAQMVTMVAVCFPVMAICINFGVEEVIPVLRRCEMDRHCVRYHRRSKWKPTSDEES